MADPEPDDRPLKLLLALVTAGFVVVLWPLIGAVMWAAIIALLFAPVQRWLCVRLKGRAGWAAFLTLAAVTLTLIVPLLVLLASLGRQASRLAADVQAGRFDLAGGVALAVLGIFNAVLWGTVMAALSLLPAVGAALVWGPIALYLAATGAPGQALGLALFGVFVIGLVDNLLRPRLVGSDTKLPDWLVLVTTLGGISLVGINGFVVGPLVAALFVTLWSLYAGRER